MKLTRKKLKELQERILSIKEDSNRYSDDIDRRLANLSRDILDLLDPPKKGYIRFPTSSGWVEFKRRKDVIKK